MPESSEHSQDPSQDHSLDPSQDHSASPSPDHSADHSPDPPQDHRPDPSPDHSRRKILIVDDQESNVRLLQVALKRGGYTAVSATTDPRTVAALHAEHRYDLILLDLRMPQMDGFEVMRALRGAEREAHVPILVLSADPSQMVHASEAGATGFLSKPFVLKDVLACVRGMLEAVPVK